MRRPEERSLLPTHNFRPFFIYWNREHSRGIGSWYEPFGKQAVRKGRNRMAEYRRFIAYFYEYIDGKRQRNAGFVKAEQRGGSWKLQLQLRAARWPEQGLPIYGYEGEGEQFSTFLLGRGYGQRDSFRAKLEYQTASEKSGAEEGRGLNGMWIPRDEHRCYLSHWLDREMDPAKLKLPELKPVEEGARPGERPETGEGEAYRESEQSRDGSPEADTLPDPDAGARQEQDVDAEENMEQEADTEERMETEGRESTGETGSASGPEEIAVKENTDFDGSQVAGMEAGELMEEKAGEDADGREPEEEHQEIQDLQEFFRGMNQHRKQKEEPQERLAAMRRVRAEKIEKKTESGAGKENQEYEKSAGKEMGEEAVAAWEMLRQSRRSVRPFSGEEMECVVICPGDVLWLGRQGWPVGKNSFLAGGFAQYRHLLLGRKPDGSFLLGVPGRDNAEEQRAARSFGFPEFRAADGGNGPFGYWCRTISRET